MKDFLDAHFDKLLLVILFFVLLMVLLHMAHDGGDAADVGWAREEANLIIGALLGLVTGARMRNGAPTALKSEVKEEPKV